MRRKQRSNNTTGKPRVVFPCLGNRIAVVIKEGPTQSEVQFLTSAEFEPTWGYYPNNWFRPYRERVKLKTSRVSINKTKRVRIK